jgi:hypothetical protein
MPLSAIHPLCCRGALACVAFGMAALLGCAPSEGIRSYDVKRESSDDAVPGPDRVRLLGAIIPVGAESSVFVKFVGPIEQITLHEKAFDDFVSSIRVGADGKSPTFTAPSGWKEGEKRSTRVVTFIPPGDAKEPPELYISTPFGGTVLMNVNRWRDEVGIPQVSADAVPRVTTPIQLGDTKAYKVDFKGPGGKKKMPPFAGKM